MTIEAYLTFVVASVVLILTPGPMVAYIITKTLQSGIRSGLLAVVGSGIVSAVQLLIVGLGIYSVLKFVGETFVVLKWVGGAYLIYLGVRTIFNSSSTVSTTPTIQVKSDRRVLIEAMLVMATNPKAILFHAAFLPLFISPTAAHGPQLALLAFTFLLIAALIDSLWALCADRARPTLSSLGLWLNRISGGIFCLAGVGLLFAKRA